MKWFGKKPKDEEQALSTDRTVSFDDFEVSLGDLMRGERATLGKSLLDVQRELHIRATYIAAIEAGDHSAFEATRFVAGYVRSNAR
ncbi:MAG: helix-turn-helix domain-containing protein [Cyclobacteriaceae bacterium]|nr:helix-turn-helix domain-containing protein [Cyclobacteriaceae bacterium]